MQPNSLDGNKPWRSSKHELLREIQWWNVTVFSKTFHNGLCGLWIWYLQPVWTSVCMWLCANAINTIYIWWCAMLHGGKNVWLPCFASTRNRRNKSAVMNLLPAAVCIWKYCICVHNCCWSNKPYGKGLVGQVQH